jgi:hypothetical protein
MSIRRSIRSDMKSSILRIESTLWSRVYLLRIRASALTD